MMLLCRQYGENIIVYYVTHVDKIHTQNIKTIKHKKTNY